MDAIQSVVGAAIGLVGEALDTERSPWAPHVLVCFPVIVLDGSLFEAHAVSGKIEVNRVDEVRVHWRGANFPTGLTPVEIVTTAALDGHLKRRLPEAQFLLKALEFEGPPPRPRRREWWSEGRSEGITWTETVHMPRLKTEDSTGEDEE